MMKLRILVVENGTPWQLGVIKDSTLGRDISYGLRFVIKFVRLDLYSILISLICTCNL